VEKGAAYAIDAARQAGVPLKVAGDGPLEAELKTRASGAPIEFLGRVSTTDVHGLLRGASMALVPSISGDVMPFAALEAMAAGVPVVASDAGSLPEVLGPESCVPKKDAHALAERIERLHRDPDRRRNEGDAGIARARERFGEQRYLDELRAVYREPSSQSTASASDAHA
jgi:glycosyltransferase involved in cell wall biosynthesis